LVLGAFLEAAPRRFDAELAGGGQVTRAALRILEAACAHSPTS
jgi:hypothetical protein